MSAYRQATRSVVALGAWGLCLLAAAQAGCGDGSGELTEWEASAPTDATTQPEGQSAEAAITSDSADSNAPIRDGGDASDSMSAAVEGGLDATVKTNCSSTHLTGCYRGMYVSLQTGQIGQNVLGGATEAYSNILGDPAKEAAVLTYIGAHRIDSLALYDLGAILGDPALTADLVSFLNRAATQGVVDVNAVGDTTQSAWDAIATFQKQNALLDGLLTEIEFWNPGVTFQQFTATLQYMRSLGVQGRSGNPIRIASYIGWPTQAQVDALVPLVDRLYVHVYVTSPDQAYGYGQQRFRYIASANAQLGTHVDVWPIFSAEGVMWKAGAETFMGDWLAAHSLDEAESTLLAGWEANPPGAGVAATGIEYYEYFFLSEYVK
jgi:hypothetical protein